MAEYLRVKNWEHFQHYKDRSPPWIKLHRELLRDYQFSCLQDASKLHLMLIWLLASQLDNRIPNDTEWLRRQIGVTEPVSLKPLIDSGFLILEQDASNTLADCKQSAMPETEAYKQETEKTHTSESAIPPCPHELIISAYHELLPERPKVVVSRWAGSASAKNLQARWKENAAHRDGDWWRGFFEAVRTNDWWMRGKEGGWAGVDLHWLVKRGNFDKVVQHWENS